METIKEYIDNALDTINKNIKELEEQKSLLASFDLTVPVDENLWHELCLTPLRASDLLGVIVKNMFPAAEDVLVHANYVYFTLYGYKIQIPTSLAEGINIDTSWYIINNDPCICVLSNENRMENYFKAKDNGASWKELADIQYSDYNKLARRLLWLCQKEYRLNEEDRDNFEEHKKRQQERLEKYNAERKETKERALFLRDTLLPELNKFSTKHYKYNNNYQLSVDEIIKYELESDTPLGD